MTVAWFTIEDLGALVRRHRADDSIARALARVIRSDLIIVDDIGLLPVSPDAAEGFYRLVDAAYERRALAVSSNLHPSGFDEIMPKTLATATVDRLMHHAHIVVTQGDSPADAGHHGPRGEALQLINHSHGGEITGRRWGHLRGRQCVEYLAAYGEDFMAIDSRGGSWASP